MTFVEFCRANGLDIVSIKGFDRVYRCPTFLKPKKKNGSYLARSDGSGWCVAFDGGGEVQFWNDKNAKPWTEADKREWRKKQEAKRESIERGYRKAATDADKSIRACAQRPHDYLREKGFPDELGLVDDKNILYVPMRDVETNNLRGAQRIMWVERELVDDEWVEAHWEKKMSFGMKAKGAVFRMGSPKARETWIVEGYATGLSVRAAIRQLRLDAAVLVSFSDSNLVYCAEIVTGTRYVFADNDVSGAGEYAAKKTGLPYCMAPTIKHDANDMHIASGIMAVCALMMKLRREARAMA